MRRHENMQLGARVAGVCALFALMASAATLAAQNSKPSIPPGELVRLAVANEVAAAHNSTIKQMFRSQKKTAKGSQTRLYVETNDAMVGMLIAIDNHALTAEQQQAEAGHLTWLMDNPDQLHKKQIREKEDAERTLRIVKALPDAFRYQYDGVVNQKQGLGAGAPLARLKFTPNASYSPPTHVEEVLTGMEGYLLIDTASRRLARIDGTLFRNVNFGWGLFGRLDKGGHFVVQQADVGDGDWEVTEMHLSITGKILLIKNLSMVSDEVFCDFHRVPDHLTFAKGVELLKAEQEKLANNKSPEPTAAKSDAKKVPQ
jgi:hypothetical protein